MRLPRRRKQSQLYVNSGNGFPGFHDVPRTYKVTSDTLRLVAYQGIPRLVAYQGRYIVLHPGCEAGQRVASERCCTRGHHRLKLAAGSSSPLMMKEEVVQSAKLCFHSIKMQ